MEAAAAPPTLLLAQLFLHTQRHAQRLDNTVSYDMIPAARNSRYDTGIHLMRYAYTERRRSLSAGAKIVFIRNDYERDVQVRKDF